MRRTKHGRVAPAKYVVRNGGATPFSARVHALENAGQEWFAATSNGLYRSEDNLKTWRKVDTDGITEVVAVAKSKDDLVIAGRSAVRVSSDNGKTWRDAKLKNISNIVSLAVSPSGELWAAAREAVFHSFDHGVNWNYDYKLTAKPIAFMAYVPGMDKVVVAGSNDTNLYETTDGSAWTAVPSGWLMRGLVNADGRLVAATAFDGVVVQSQR
ncbi:MAG: hypothetical protein JOZ43_01370 [Acidobacteriales bacterium]|nr:hypothetical protein [Terriglobales bacterium]